MAKAIPTLYPPGSQSIQALRWNRKRDGRHTRCLNIYYSPSRGNPVSTADHPVVHPSTNGHYWDNSNAAEMQDLVPVIVTRLARAGYGFCYIITDSRSRTRCRVSPVAVHTMRKGLATHHALRNGFAIATPSTQIDPLRPKWVGTESRFVARSSKRVRDREPVIVLLRPKPGRVWRARGQNGTAPFLCA